MGRYVVVDLEMCRVPRQRRTREYHYGTEIIQIGAVLLNDSFNVIDEFNTYVSPEYGYVDKFISKLTDITQSDVSKAPSLREAIEAFMKWFPADAKMVAWSTSDEKQLRRECEQKGFITEKLEGILNESLDCQDMFIKKIDIDRAYKLEEAFVLTDISTEGRLHNGLADAKNTAKLFKKIMTDIEFKLNPIYEQAHSEEIVHLGSSLGNLLSGLCIEFSA